MQRRATQFIAALVLGLFAASASSRESGRAIYLQTLKGTGFIEIRAQGKTVAFGTGWIVDAEQRLMVTNHHVVGNDPVVHVTFPAYDKGRPIADPKRYAPDSALAAKVIDTDPKRDLAVIQLERLPAGVTALPLAKDSPMPGDGVFLVGNPG